MECPERVHPSLPRPNGAAAADGLPGVGDSHAAEDLTQIALTRTLLAWRRINRLENAHAYAHRTLVMPTSASAGPAGRRGAAGSAARAPSRGTAALRVVLLDALAALPRRARAVVVLRYWEDLSVDQVAEICAAPPAT